MVVLSVVALVIITIILVPQYYRSKRMSSRLGCGSNLKQIALSFRMFAGDNEQKFPFETRNSVAYTNDSQAWLHFMAMSNELGSTKILLCPSDIGQKSPADGFTSNTNSPKLQSLATLKNNAVSYFVGLDAKDGNHDTWLSGDGRLSNASHSHNGPLLYANDPSKLHWLQPIHDDRPNVAMASGMVQRGRNLTNSAPWPTNTSNRLLLPQ